MAGLDSSTPIPSRVVVHKQSRILELGFADGQVFRLPFELMRVYSPSAEVRGHGPGQEVLQVGKREVGIDSVEAVGHYAIQPRFTDGHDTGIYSWDYLHWLGSQQTTLWKDYLGRLEAAGASRDAAPATAPSAAHATPPRSASSPEQPAAGQLNAVPLTRPR
jgi:DUF971 family protein